MSKTTEQLKLEVKQAEAKYNAARHALECHKQAQIQGAFDSMDVLTEELEALGFRISYAPQLTSSGMFAKYRSLTDHFEIRVKAGDFGRSAHPVDLYLAVVQTTRGATAASLEDIEQAIIRVRSVKEVLDNWSGGDTEVGVLVVV